MVSFGNSAIVYLNEADFLASGVGEFDLDIVADSEHPKRYAHLFELTNYPNGDELGYESHILKPTVLRDSIFVVSALVLAIIIQNQLVQRIHSVSYRQPMQSFSIGLLPPESVPRQKVATTAEPLAVENSEPEENGISGEESPETSENTFEKIEAREDSGDKSSINLRDQVKNIVKGLDAPDDIVLREGLGAPGLIFDSNLRAKLDSPEIERLNRWRAPTDAVVNNPGGLTLTKIGDLCFFSSITAQGGNIVELPLIGNGWNLNYYKEVDCDNYFKEQLLDRTDIVPAPPK